MARSTKPLPPVNPRQQAARRKNTAAIRRSAESKEAARVAWDRSGGRCEFNVDVARELGVQVGGLEYRCQETENLDEHHDDYRPGRIRVRIFCRAHHQFWERIKRWWRRNGR